MLQIDHLLTVLICINGLIEARGTPHLSGPPKHAVLSPCQIDLALESMLIIVPN